ncbi:MULTISPECIES: TraB/GumN family protein [Halocynthiibacter]|uniref:TraB/GumN family protein n=1 Tax=Halocynthiibacter halioticoli TaxID=2986804 RepID=A0AAE3IYY1_9RHOB|nr:MULTISPECIES: TraB/GumN family protein [Halocynthiibacter]MCV6823700.1 TraB/GumN family protein [Halocynthiibacter halioticoli]MCW4056701.1 TraB/GumN family protein [Halocynthiibacter sp. SDUM655004]
MRKTLKSIAFLLLSALPAAAACEGENLIAALPDDQREALVSTAHAKPFPVGNLWHAKKDGSDIYVQGTLHMPDARHEAQIEKLKPLIDASDIVFFEANSEDLAKAQDAIGSQPELLFITDGPSLPELLTEEEWQLLSDQMTQRGIPAFLASKFKPSYAMMTLSVPPCASELLTGKAKGLDHLLMAYAEGEGIPTSGLEPYDTALTFFDQGEDETALDFLRTALAQADISADMNVTLVDAYFEGEHSLIWEFSRLKSYETPGTTREEVTEMLTEVEELMINGRNRNWMDVLLPAAEDATVVVAVGAAHLAGDEGVLNLLAEAGYTLTPME